MEAKKLKTNVEADVEDLNKGLRNLGTEREEGSESDGSEQMEDAQELISDMDLELQTEAEQKDLLEYSDSEDEGKGEVREPLVVGENPEGEKGEKSKAMDIVIDEVWGGEEAGGEAEPGNQGGEGQGMGGDVDISLSSFWGNTSDQDPSGVLGSSSTGRRRRRGFKSQTFTVQTARYEEGRVVPPPRL